MESVGLTYQRVSAALSPCSIGESDRRNRAFAFRARTREGFNTPAQNVTKADHRPSEADARKMPTPLHLSVPTLNFFDYSKFSAHGGNSGTAATTELLRRLSIGAEQHTHNYQRYDVAAATWLCRCGAGISEAEMANA